MSSAIFGTCKYSIMAYGTAEVSVTSSRMAARWPRHTVLNFSKKYIIIECFNPCSLVYHIIALTTYSQRVWVIKNQLLKTADSAAKIILKNIKKKLNRSIFRTIAASVLMKI